jgi:membrane protease YdiL (CAAX protease family)
MPGAAEILFGAIVVLALPWRAYRRYRRRDPPAAASIYVIETSLLIAGLGGLLWSRGVEPTAIGLGMPGPLRFAGDVVLCVGTVVAVDAFSFWRATRGRSRAASRGAAEIVPPDTLAARRALAPFVAVTIVGAVWEELCFRGTLFLLVPHTWSGILLAVAAGSLLFGAQHLRNGPTGVAYTTCFGLMFWVLYLASGNLMAVMIAHAAGNLLAVLQWAPRMMRAAQTRRQEPMFLG